MKNPIKLLDLCCKAGGAAVGYEQAANALGISIEITGIDLDLQPNYPYNFIQYDAVKYLEKYGHQYTHIHTSPPCQKHSCATKQFQNKGKEYPCIIEPLRKLIYDRGLPGVIENVRTAPVIPDIILRGDMFGLKVQRVRHFELINWFMMNPVMPKLYGSVKNGDFVSVFGKAGWRKAGNEIKRPDWKKKTIRETWAYAMGVEHYMTDVELSESIPPAYTNYIGQHFFEV